MHVPSRCRRAFVRVQASTNPDHKPIRVNARTEDIAIVGVVVGAIMGTRRAA